jgi:hypothetical protein
VSQPGLTIDDTARFLSHATWLERRLFEAVGAWVPSTPERAVKLAFARESRRFGWHAELLEPLRPSTRDHDVAERGPLDASWRTLFARMLAATTTAARLERLEDVLGLAIDCYESHLARRRGFRDAPTMRVVQIVLADERAALAELSRF